MALALAVIAAALLAYWTARSKRLAAPAHSCTAEELAKVVVNGEVVEANEPEPTAVAHVAPGELAAIRGDWLS